MSDQGLPVSGAILTVMAGRQVRYYKTPNAAVNDPRSIVLSEGQIVGKYAGQSSSYNNVTYLWVEADTNLGRLFRWIIADYVSWPGKPADFVGGTGNITGIANNPDDPDDKKTESGYGLHIILLGVIGILMYKRILKKKKKR